MIFEKSHPFSRATANDRRRRHALEPVKKSKQKWSSSQIFKRQSSKPMSFIGKKWVQSRDIQKPEIILNYGTTLEVLDLEMWFINFESLWSSLCRGWRPVIIGKTSSTTILTKNAPNLEKLNFRLWIFACVMLAWHVNNGQSCKKSRWKR